MVGSNLSKKDSKNDSDRPKDSTFKIPSLEISKEREEEIIKNFTDTISEHGFESPALLFLIPLKPISPIASQLTLLPFAPLMEAFDIPAYDYVAFLRKMENMDRILEVIEENMDKKEKKGGWLSNLFKKWMNKSDEQK
jgi:translation initiation factor 2 beta subunit (eIF-2beta)/eIF-5